MLFDIIALQTCKYCVRLANACLNIEDMPSMAWILGNLFTGIWVSVYLLLRRHFDLLHNLSFKIISQLVCQ